MNCPRCSRQIPDDAVLCCYCGRTIVRKPASKIHQRPNGSGTVFQRKGQKTWTAQYTVPSGWYIDENGKRHRKYKTKGGFEKKTDALAFIESLKKDAEKKPCPPLRTYWKLYSTGEMKSLSASKQTAYEIAWGKLKCISDRPVDTLTVSDLRDCVSDEATTYYPARDMKVLLSHLFRLAAADSYANKDLPSFINLPEKEESEREIFTTDEQKTLWKTYESGCTDAALPLIMIYTGMMPGELNRLEGSMVNWDDNTITGVGMKTKVRKAAPVYFPDDIKPVLAEIVKGNPGRIFTLHKTSLYDRYYKALETAGVRRLAPYSCRHTTATRLAIDNTIAPQTVRKVMRWSTTKMLDLYAHPNDSDALAAIQTLNKPDPSKPDPSKPDPSKQDPSKQDPSKPAPSVPSAAQSPSAPSPSTQAPSAPENTQDQSQV